MLIKRPILYHWLVAARVTPEIEGLAGHIGSFLNFCRAEKGLAANTLEAYSTDLERFSSFQQGRSAIPSTDDVRAYIDYLHSSGLGSRSIARHLTTIRTFVSFLLRVRGPAGH